MTIQNSAPQTCEHKKNAKRQHGYSLLELMIVLAVIAGLVAIVVFTAQSLWSSSNSEKLFQGLSTLDQNIKATYGSDYTNVTTQNLIQINAVPKELGINSDADAILTPWEGSITIDDTGTYSFSVPSSACSKIIPLLFGNVINLHVNSTAPSTVSDAISSCIKNPNISFSFN